MIIKDNDRCVVCGQYMTEGSGLVCEQCTQSSQTAATTNEQLRIEVRTTTVYESILDKFNESIKAEENKYPFTDREKLFIDTIKDLLKALDNSHRRW